MPVALIRKVNFLGGRLHGEGRRLARGSGDESVDGDKIDSDDSCC